MGVGLGRLIVFLSLISLIAHPSFAGELADFNAAVEKAAVHQRAALSQLRNGNAEQAGREIEHMSKAWAALVTRFGSKPPDAFDGNVLYTPTLADVTQRIVRASRMIGARRGDAAREALTPIRAALSQMRRTSGVTVLADCILDANTAMDDFYAFKDNPPDWTRPENRFAVATKSAVYRRELQRCDSIAPGQVRADPQFRRVLDGAFAGLDLVQGAINARDTDLLMRILNELRSFDTMLALRYG